MNNKEYISAIQFYFIVVGIILGTAIILSNGLDIAGRDIWIAHLMAMMTGVLKLIVIFLIYDKYPGKESSEMLEELFGKTISKFIMLVFLFFAVALCGLILDNIGEFIILMVIQYTKEWVYVMSMSLLAGFILSRGIEVSSRSIQIGMSTSIIIYIIILISLSNSVDFNALQPMFSKDFKDIFKTAIILSSFPYLEIGIIFYLVPSIRKNERKKALKLGILGVVTATALIIIIELFIISIFGEKESGRILYTTYEVVRMINIGDFFQRVEILILWVWFITVYTKFTICFYAILKSIQGIFNLKDYKKTAIPVSLFLVPVGVGAYKNYEQISTLTIKTWPVIMLLMLFVLIVMLIVTIIKDKYKRG